MTTSIREALLKEIEAFLARHKMAPAKFGQQAVSDMGFVLRLRAGRDVRISTADRAREFMRNYKPVKPKRPKAAQERAHAA